MTDNRGPESRRKLYRNPAKAKICGVCAGVAEYFGFEVWVVRIITVSLVLLGWGPIVLAYFVLYFVLDPNPNYEKNGKCDWKPRKTSAESKDFDENKPYRPSVKEVWKSAPPPDQLLSEIEGKFSNIERHLQDMETYVTSRRFNLDKEFSKMEP